MAGGIDLRISSATRTPSLSAVCMGTEMPTNRAVESRFIDVVNCDVKADRDTPGLFEKSDRLGEAEGLMAQLIA